MPTTYANPAEVYNTLKSGVKEFIDVVELPKLPPKATKIVLNLEGKHEIRINPNTEESLLGIAHEIEHAKQFNDFIGIYKKYPFIFNEKFILGSQMLSLPLILWQQNPGYVVPMLQTLAAAPILYTELEANRGAIETLKKYNIGPEDIAKAKGAAIRNFAGYAFVFGLIPVLSSAYVYKKRQHNAEAAKRNETNNKQPMPLKRMALPPGWEY